MVDKNNITDKYYHILELLDKSPGDEEALNALIELEEDIKSYLFDVLKSKHANDFDKSNVYSKFQKGNKDRDRLESLIMNKTTGDRLSINDITDLFIKKINDILAMPINNQEKIKLLNIQYLQIKETILPPDYDRKPIIGSGNGWIEKGEDFDRFGLLIQILREQGVYTDDILAIEGINKKNMMRRDSYICLYIPRIDKTIFINNNYGEATFVYDGSMEIEWFTSLGKEGLKSDFKKITFSEKNIDLWKNEILHALFHSGDKKEKILGEKTDVRVIKNDIKKKYQKQEFLDFYERLVEEDKQKIYSKIKYQELAKQYPELPQSHGGLIGLLGGNNKCTEGGYIKTLIEGKGEEYFNNWNKPEEKKKKEKKKEKKQEFLEFYERLTEEERQNIYYRNKYEERSKKYPELPQSYGALIRSFGGNRRCTEGGYVKALIEGTGDEYIKEREIRTNKPEEEKRQEFLDIYERLTKEDKQKIHSKKKYQELAKQYPELPQSYNGLISLLGGNFKCREQLYVKALIEGTGEEYFNKWNKSEEEKKQEFLDLYERLPKEEKQKIYSLNKYKELAKQYLELPKSYQGFIILLGGRVGCAESGYVKALIQGKGEEYIKERELRINKPEKEKKQEFLDIYVRIPEEYKQKIYFGEKYRERAKQYPELPQSYNGLIPLLGGNNKCKEGGYVKALIEGTGEEYFNNWELRINKPEKEKKQDFLDVYETLQEEEKQNIYSRSKYGERVNQYPRFPQTYIGLIPLLGGNPKCVEGGYIKSLIEGKGEEYFNNWELRINKPEKEKKQDFLDVYERLTEEERQNIYYRNKYEERSKKYPNLPKSYYGLIPLLGGNKKCAEGGYIKSLIEGKGEEYFNNWELRINKPEKEKKQDFLDVYERLPEEERQKIYSTRQYVERVKQYPNLPKSYVGLIPLLGGNTKCLEGGYIKALIEGKGEEYFNNWEKGKK